ncbi:MAG: translation initiation factor IF-3 [Candidatus Vogelbacteria bacterium CG10_big_fil_rev_8_21_14_0_10_49_38]|uniref:Translation initiation factor IF-3 n=1 Tax=Candidatus Vogelbacteria bacterium CG10_big_fil_rev_8_21_14_0_10_49_38 TaxID=1975043 RepID=A0A2H0RIK1_9BACT|nr:MAG: translation initiation factor IF-3 [bacterium CG10_49_38]PIR46369.1 MAG: translation initiation factor IF-3 [Candidatus Vogelbacteria bacterium CG10_big_fil_rev_8_21_14_0_10_49_38]
MYNPTRINQQIRARDLRVIDAEGNNFGVLSLAAALAKAKELAVDLIEISPNAVPPVAKLMDFGKYQYLEQKKQKLAKGAGGETKSLQVKIGTGEHDLELKAKKASQFLKEGHRVKINLFLPGRSKYLDPNFLKERLDRVLHFISEDYKIAVPPQKGPKGLTVVIDRAARKDKTEGTAEPG